MVRPAGSSSLEGQSGPASSRASCSSSTGASGGQVYTGPQSKTTSAPAGGGGGKCRSFVNALSRRKPLDCRTETHLNRCLNLIDLTALGVGSTLGLGLYVLAGEVASIKAGPAVVISFALAALASAFSALCYAEFAGRVPRAGSAYAYSYITVGEFVAFIIGWNLILEYVIGASSVARGFSGYISLVYNHVSESSTQTTTATPTIEPASANESLQQQQQLANLTTMRPTTLAANATASSAGLLGAHLLSTLAPNTADGSASFVTCIVNYVTEHFDWPSVAICFVITVFILFGVKESTNVTLAFTAVNLLVVIAVVISSLGYLDLHNWRLTKSEVPAGYGEGGFLPYGWSGVLAGSATCFFGFIGFDTIASSAEEARNPKRNVPLSILFSLFISFVAYMAVAIVQTLIWPYYDQNSVTILPHIFAKLDMPLTYWVVLLGAIAGLTSSQLGGMYPLPRILYSMAHDKLIYACLAHVNKRLKLPVRATIVGSIFIAILACLLEIRDLADMVSIGTLAAYSLVSLSVLILRYEDRSDAIDDSTIMAEHLGLTDVLANAEERADNNCAPAVGLDDAVTTTATATTITMKQTADEKLDKLATTKDSVLSAGLCKSWLKKTGDKLQPTAAQTNCELSQDGEERCAKQTASNKRPSSLLDLLIVWRADETQGAQSRRPDERTSKQSKLLIAAIVVLSVALDLVALCLTSGLPERWSNNNRDETLTRLLDPRIVLTSSGCILLVALAAVLLMLSRLPASKTTQRDLFRVPLVPLIPTLSILVNTFLMLNLSYLTWIRFAVWMAFGLFIYFTYGIWNSRGHLLRLAV